MEQKEILKEVVDLNGKIVEPFSLQNKIIEELENGVVLIKEPTNNPNTIISTRVLKRIDGELTQILFYKGAVEVISDHIIKTKNDPFDSGYEALFDMGECKYISPKFNQISSYDNERGYAKAYIKLSFKNKACKEFNEVLCLIDKEGNIVSSVLDIITNSSYEITNYPSFEDLIKEIKNNMEIYKSRKNNINEILIKSIKLPQKKEYSKE